MPKSTHSEPYIYDKDKKGKPVKKWCTRYSIQYPGERTECPKEYSKSYEMSRFGEISNIFIKTDNLSLTRQNCRRVIWLPVT